MTTTATPAPALVVTDPAALNAWLSWPAGKPSYTNARGQRTRAWRGHDPARLRAQADELDYIDHGIQALQAARARVLLERTQAVQDLLGISVILGEAYCEHSPTEQCVYSAADPDRAACLFCGTSAAEPDTAPTQDRA